MKNNDYDYELIEKKFKQESSPQKVLAAKRFFKCGVGEYSEHDDFLGIPVPRVRLMAKEILNEREDKVFLKKLLQSPYNEIRLLALILLVEQFTKAKMDEEKREAVFQFYLKHKNRVNNWNLVDASSHQIVGTHLLKGPKDLLFTLAKSSSLWERRIAIVSTLAFIKAKDFAPTLQLVQLLKKDPEDLTHKAMGWMLREVGKKDVAVLRTFLRSNLHTLPRTTLRYSIERLEEKERKFFLQQ